MGLSVICSMYQLTHGLSNFYFIREFAKRMDMDLPFHYWTLNERYSEDAYPSFDNRPDIDEDEDVRRSTQRENFQNYFVFNQNDFLTVTECYLVDN